ncbi:siderophore-interacting protein [Candidatus Mycobacterium wuenschmannii]|uniref:Siderophore-interacting protein n=1 Tax=Candidatus Mycobacterium wuenschmannii TaxID=3027808 RepID=A0ABY8VWH2_9MYCO|nr:siderophore-interacting protein [Candidatus Mycobacterium wuenschmannii]
MRDAVFLSATVSDTEQLTPTLRRIRFSGKRLQGLTWAPGQHVRLQVAGLGESLLRLQLHDALRTYSIYDVDPELGTLDIVMFDHRETGTPAKRWASAVAVGDNVQFTKPQGNLVIRGDAPYHLFVGDETASVAFAAMLRALPASADVYGVVEAAAQPDHLPLARPLQQVQRGEASAKDSVVLAEAVRELTLPDDPGVAYLAGEARTIQTVRKILVAERGWDRRNIRTSPFWTPGRSGLE